MGAPQPDIAGFADAQRRLRASLGREVTFFTPDKSATTWPAEVGEGQFDPETQLPYDPTIRPEPTVGSAAAAGLPDDEFPYKVGSATCSVVFQPLATVRRDETQQTALGTRSRMNKDLIADPADLEVFADARYFRLDGEFWRVEQVVPDGIGALQRYVIYGEALR